MALFGLVWRFYGLKWHFMVFYGRISSFLAVIDPNSFGLVTFVRTLKSFVDNLLLTLSISGAS